MAPFNEAVQVQEANTGRVLVESGGGGRVVDYEGVLDPTWNIGNVPCGGYSLAIALEACIQHQSQSGHIDPLHLSAHFLRPTTSSAPFVVRVRTLKAGKAATNLTADFIQEGTLRVSTHAIFGHNGPAPAEDGGQPGYTLQPPSSYARRIPIHIHPSQTQGTPMFHVWKRNRQVSWAFDPETIKKNELGHPNRTNGDSVGGGGTEWAAWFQFEAKTEKLTNVYLPLLVDMFMNTINLIPREERGQLGPSWSPTMTLALDFKFPIRNLSPIEHSKRTVGLYSAGRFITEPHGRHDVFVEVWSAPSEISQGGPQAGWRDKQICLAIATQMALRLPMEVNLRNGERKLKEKANL